MKLIKKINFQTVQIIAVLIGGVLVASPFIARIIERSHYQVLGTEIVAYIDGIREKGGNCTVNIREGEISSDCGDSMVLPKHIVLEPLTLNYEDKVLMSDEILVISSRHYPEQYCIGFDGLLIKAGYYDGQCNAMY